MSIERVFDFAKVVGALISGVASYCVGGFDKLLLFLVILTALDIVTGICKALHMGKLNSTVNLKGLIRKAGIYVIVAVCHLADQALGLTILRDGAIGFYIVMELISITENWGQMGLPMPTVLKKALAQLQEDEPEGVKINLK